MALEQLTETEWSGTYCQFFGTGMSASGLTKVWLVQACIGGDRLGFIRWASRWRKYALFPEPYCLFEETCLRDIAQFIEDRTKEHKS